MINKTARGLLIDDEFIEILEVKRGRRGLTVGNYSWRRLAEGIVSRGRVIRPKELAEEIRQLVAGGRSGPINGPVVLGLPQEQVIIKVFTLPKFDDKDATEAINWHISSLGPVVPKEAYFAHKVVGKSDASGLTVLLAAAPKAVVDDYLEAAGLADIKVMAVEPVALSRIRLLNHKQLENKAVAMVSLAGGQLSIAIVNNAKLWFSQETRLKTYDQREIARLTGEMLRFFEERKEVNSPAIEAVVLVSDPGGTTLLRTALKPLGLPLTDGEPEWSLTASVVIASPDKVSLSPVFGLALAGQLEEREWLSLLPSWPQQKYRAESLSRLSQKTAIFAGITVVGITLSLVGGWWRLQQSSRSLAAEVLAQQLPLNQDGGVASWAAAVNRTVQRIELIEKQRSSQAEMLTQLAGLTPAGIRLTALSMEFKQNSWSLSGIAENREAVLLFYEQLKQSRWFNQAKLYFSSLESSQGIIFRLSGGKR